MQRNSNDAAWGLAERVRVDLDRKSCPGVYMNIAMESIVKHFPSNPISWIPATLHLVESQDDWIAGPLWIATSRGVFSAKYEWRQGCNPHQFDTEGAGTFSLSDVTHIMPLVKPERPVT